MSGTTPNALIPGASAALARNWGAVVLRGVLAVIFGLIALWTPQAALLSLVWVFGAYAIVDGVFTLISAVRAAGAGERWFWLVVEGIVDIAAGLVAFFMPILTAVVMIYVLGAWAIITGVVELVAAFRLEGSHGRIWLVLGGIVSVVWGVLLFLAPMLGAIVTTIWIGAYALIFGISLIILGFRLRSRHQAA